MPPPVKIYDRPAGRKAPPLYLIALAVVIVLIAGFFIYKMANHPQEATKTPSTGMVFPLKEFRPASPAKLAVG